MTNNKTQQNVKSKYKNAEKTRIFHLPSALPDKLAFGSFTIPFCVGVESTGAGLPCSCAGGFCAKVGTKTGALTFGTNGFALILRFENEVAAPLF